MNIPVAFIILSNLIIFFSFYTRSLLGFGGALISIPLMAFLFPLRFAVPLEAIFEVLLSLMLIRGEWRRVDKKIMAMLLVGSFIGTLIGTYVLKSFSNVMLLKMLGIIIILFSLNLLRKNDVQPVKKFSWPIGVIIGTISGILGGIFGTSGPPIVLYLAYQIKVRNILRATLIGYFMFDFAVRLVVFGASGFLTTSIGYYALLLTPGLIVGTLFGKKHFIIVDDRLYKKAVIAILIVSGILLFFK